MFTREELFRKIKEELKGESGLKARVIARRLSVEKREVNRILYSVDYGDQFQKDESYMWYLAESMSNKVSDNAKVNMVIPSIMKKETEVKPTCKKCMLYKNEMCFGETHICSDFRNSPDISAEEMELWPKEMSGPYGTLHNGYHKAYA